VIHRSPFSYDVEECIDEFRVCSDTENVNDMCLSTDECLGCGLACPDRWVIRANGVRCDVSVSA